MIRAAIVDDEPFAREEIRVLLADHSDVDVVAGCANAIEALRVIRRDRPDVVFLDIEMPKISGLELIGMLDDDEVPRIVFVTAFDDYAVAAFEENAFDYLLKPIEKVRFDKTLARVRKSLGGLQSLKGLDLPAMRQIPCFLANRIRLVRVDDVEFAFRDISGVHVVTGDEACYTDLSLKSLEEKTDLVRCHRQYLVRLDRVREIRLLDGGLAEIATCGGKVVPVSRRHLRDLKGRFGLA